MSRVIEGARRIARRLKEAGYEAYFAGGSVRDALLGIEPRDVDVATSAPPEDVQRLFRRTMAVGEQFGVIIVVESGVPYDVATFRSDGAYVDGRRPDSVTFATAEEDVARRDFTINGLLMDPETGEILDFVGGRADLEAQVIRTIGDPGSRFEEDRLRILRAIRFAARLDFEIEPMTRAAIESLAVRAADPSPERVFGELDRMLTERDPGRAVRLMDELGVLRVVLPEVASKRGRQSERRLIGDVCDRDAMERTLRLLDACRGAVPPRPVAWAVLLGDIDPGSPRRREAAARAVLKRLRCARDLQDGVASLVLRRDRLLFARRISRARISLFRAAPDRADMVHLHAAESRAADPDELAPRSADPGPEDMPPPLLRGGELLALGAPPGRALGRLMKIQRYLQLEGRLKTPEDARAWVRQHLAGS